MKPKTKVAVCSVLLLGIVGGTAAILYTPADQSPAESSTVQSDKDKGLPSDCTYFEAGNDEHAVLCKDSHLDTVLTNPLVQKASHLSLEHVTLGTASLADLPNLKTLALNQAADPQNLSAVIKSASGLKTLNLTDPLPEPLDVTVKNVNIGAVNDQRHVGSIKHIDPNFSATNINSADFYELSGKAASTVETLKVPGVIEGEKVDLEHYGSLNTLNITVSKNSKLRLPAHLRDSTDYSMEVTSAGTTFIAPKGDS